MPSCGIVSFHVVQVAVFVVQSQVVDVVPTRLTQVAYVIEVASLVVLNEVEAVVEVV